MIFPEGLFSRSKKIGLGSKLHKSHSKLDPLPLRYPRPYILIHPWPKLTTHHLLHTHNVNLQSAAHQLCKRDLNSPPLHNHYFPIPLWFLLLAQLKQKHIGFTSNILHSVCRLLSASHVESIPYLIYFPASHIPRSLPKERRMGPTSSDISVPSIYHLYFFLFFIYSF